MQDHNNVLIRHYPTKEYPKEIAYADCLNFCEDTRSVE